MYWTLELASYLEDAPWPASKDELIDFSVRSGAPMEVVENLQSWKTTDNPLKVLKRYGPIIQLKTISFSMKMSINQYHH